MILSISIVESIFLKPERERERVRERDQKPSKIRLEKGNVKAQLPPQSSTMYLVSMGNFLRLDPPCSVRQKLTVRQYKEADSGSKAIAIKSFFMPA